jgi:hypothetical protein
VVSAPDSESAEFGAPVRTGKNCEAAQNLPGSPPLPNQVRDPGQWIGAAQMSGHPSVRVPQVSECALTRGSFLEGGNIEYLV